MKILFANPPWWTVEADPNKLDLDRLPRLRRGIRAGSRWPFTLNSAFMPDTFTFGQYTPFPHFLAHAAAYTKMLMPDAEVVVRDSVARGESYQRFELWMQDEKPDWVVLETATSSLEHDLRLCRYYADVKWILCGPINKNDYSRILHDCPNVYAIAQGEFDKQIKFAIEGQRGDIHEHDLLTRDEIANPPFPMWDEDCWDHYCDACPSGTTFPQLQMWTSRGCPFFCSFCLFPANMTGDDPLGKGPRSVRFHSEQWIENYIWDRLSKHKFSSIYLDDDTVNLNNNHTLALCRIMKKVGLPWSAMCRADTIPHSTWQEMRDSGCFGVKIGMESGSQRVIDEIINKRLNIAKAVETCKFLQGIGINVHTTWSIGAPGETDAEKQSTLDLIKRMYDEGAHTTNQLSGMATLENTPLAHIAKGEKLDRYKGAIADDHFEISSDGQRKIEKMVQH